ncbi:MAG: MipA/OmpV family protein [Pseudomonadota bacterium]
MVHEATKHAGARFLVTVMALVGAAIGAPAVAQNVVNAGNSAGDDDGALPLWELGAGAAAAYVPAYPGASATQTRALPLPIVIYRGSFLRAGDGSLVSGKLIENDKLELDISLNGSFNADSDDVAIRSGMPDLGFLFEIGPELEWHLTPEDSDRHWKLEFPVRAAFSVDDGDLNSRSWVFNPELELEMPGFFNPNDELSVAISMAFAGESLMEYLYEVPNRFATPARPAFDAKAGYLGSQLSVSWSHRAKQRFFIVGVAATFLDGAENTTSPLVEERVNISLFAAVAWSLIQSKRPAPKARN